MSCQSDINRELVIDYFDLIFCQRNPEHAATVYLHQDYIHHGNGSGSAREDFVFYFLNFFRTNPGFKAEVLHSLSERDMVALRVVTTYPDSSISKMVAEFYRLKDGKIIEHWHIVEN
jgi:predicted SnoaL-like aldol condensation-catalyzing enzyme